MHRMVPWATVATVVFCLWSSELSLADHLLDRPLNPLAGSRVFGDKGCSTCHAINGFGGQIGPDLARLSSARSLYDLAAAMWNHIPRMVARMRELGIARPLLSSQEAGDLVAFLSIFNYFDPPGNLEGGERLFSEKKCVICHQVRGVGGIVGPNLDSLSHYGAPIFVAAAMWNHGPTMAAAMRAKGIERPTFKKQELLDLIAYLKSSAPEPRGQRLYIIGGARDHGRKLFRDKGCMECHSISGQGGRIGPDLAGLQLGGGVVGLAVAMWNKAPQMMKAMENKNISVPQIEAGEMAHIVAYLYSVKYFAETGNSNEGRKLLDTKRCLSCHSLDGREGKVADDLGQMKGFDSLSNIISALWNHIAIPQYIESQRTAWPQFLPHEMADLEAFFQEVGRSRR